MNWYDGVNCILNSFLIGILNDCDCLLNDNEYDEWIWMRVWMNVSLSKLLMKWLIFVKNDICMNIEMKW